MVTLLPKNRTEYIRKLMPLFSLIRGGLEEMVTKLDYYVNSIPGVIKSENARKYGGIFLVEHGYIRPAVVTRKRGNAVDDKTTKTASAYNTYLTKKAKRGHSPIPVVVVKKPKIGLAPTIFPPLSLDSSSEEIEDNGNVKR